MTKKKSKSTQTTLYRLNRVSDLKTAIKGKYIEIFNKENCEVGGRKCLLIAGTIKTEKAKWCERVEKLTSRPLAFGNENSAAVLLIPEAEGLGDNVWALCWGMGWLLLEPSKIDVFFGQRVAIRVIDPEQLASITKRTLDENSKIDITSIPSGEKLASFGFEGFGEIVTRIVAKADLSLFGLNKKMTIKGSDSLSVPLGDLPDTLIADLDRIREILSQKAPSEFEVLEQFRLVKSNEPVVEKLENTFIKLLNNPDKKSIGLAWPMQAIEGRGIYESYRVKGAGKSPLRIGSPSLEEIRESVLKNQDIRKALTTVKVQLFEDSDGQSAASQDIAAKNWFACEVSLENQDSEKNCRYFLHEGKWYQIDFDYAERLDELVQKIFDKGNPINLPRWREKENEDKYNKRAVKELAAQLFDKKLIRTRQNARGFEACDILTTKGDLVHVKKADGSGALSHLFAQGANSAVALMDDLEALQKFQASININGIDAETWKPEKVVFGICKTTNYLDAKSLFSFSKITLYRTFVELEKRGIDVYVVPIALGDQDDEQHCR